MAFVRMPLCVRFLVSFLFSGQSPGEKMLGKIALVLGFVCVFCASANAQQYYSQNGYNFHLRVHAQPAPVPDYHVPMTWKYDEQNRRLGLWSNSQGRYVAEISNISPERAFQMGVKNIRLDYPVYRDGQVICPNGLGFNGWQTGDVYVQKGVKTYAFVEQTHLGTFSTRFLNQQDYLAEVAKTKQATQLASTKK